MRRSASCLEKGRLLRVSRLLERTTGTDSQVDRSRKGDMDICAPHHARPARRGIIWVFMDFVFALVVKQKFLRNNWQVRCGCRADSNQKKLTSRTRLGPQPMPSVLFGTGSQDKIKLRMCCGMGRTISPCPCRWLRSWRSAPPKCRRSLRRCWRGEVGLRSSPLIPNPTDTTL